jgi:exonuclease VII large subunit
MNKITTTITATAPQKQRLRYRLSLSKRSSYQPVASPPFPASPVSSPPNTIPLASPTPSAPNPAEHEDRRATFQFTTAAEIAAKIKADEEKLAQAAEVIRRDKPKDWLDPGWREREEKERERVLAEKKLEEDQLLEAEKRDAEAVAGVRIGRDGVDSGPLRRWEWGR